MRKSHAIVMYSGLQHTRQGILASDEYILSGHYHSITGSKKSGSLKRVNSTMPIQGSIKFLLTSELKILIGFVWIKYSICQFSLPKFHAIRY